MSFIPHFDTHYPSSWHHFGSGVHPSDMPITPTEHWSLSGSLSNFGNYLKHLSHLDELMAKSHIGKDGFQVCLDVQHFQPNEISVKTENDSIIVLAKHDEKKDDHGHISREFNRRYELPKGFKVEDVASTLSSDGVLSVKCPPAPAIKGSNVRHIQIQQTGPAKLNIKNNDEKKDEEKK